MNSNRQAVPKPIVVGACLALFTILLGFVLGAVFGAVESSIKAHLDNSGTTVLQSVYEGDVAAKEAVVSKSWAYLKRAHLHAGGIGAAAVAAIATLIQLSRLGMIANLSGLALGFGGLIYSLFWLFAGLIAPGIGSTGVAKETLWYIAIPGAGLCVLGMLGSIYAVVESNFCGSEKAGTRA